jgi:hypothetical protein
LVDELFGIASFFEPKLPSGSFSLKQALLVELKLWVFTRNLSFPVILTCAILALRDPATLSTAS